MRFNKSKLRKSGVYFVLGMMFTGIFLGGAEAGSIRRIEGPDRYQTSMNVADHHKSDIAIVVNGKDFPDALSAISLATKYKANIILVKPSSDDLDYRKFTADLLNRKVKNVIIVGTDGISPLQEDSMTVLMSAYLIRSRVVPRKNGFRLYNYYMVVGMRAFFI